MKLILLLLFLSASLAYAQGPDHEYIRIYNLITQADNASEGGHKDMAAVQYRDALAALKKLQTIYPKWNQDLIKYRLEYLANKVQASAQFLPETNAVPSRPSVAVDASPQVLALNEEIRRLRDDRSMLEAKLKEALSIQPNATSSVELAKAEERMIALQKERDLLKVTLEQAPTSTTSQAVAASEAESEKLKALQRERDQLQNKLAAALSAKIDQVQVGKNEEVEQLRARLEALEARPTPFTAEELALFKQTPPQLAVAEAKPKKTSREIPAGAGALVAQAERAFAARRFDEAERKYLEVLRQDEENVHILGNLAATQMEMNNITAAEKNINHALEIDPEDSFSLTLLGMLKFRQGKMDEAFDLLSRSARIDPANPETQNYLGITLSQKGQRTAAEAALRKAIKLQPNYGGAHHNLAVIYATQRPPFLELARWHYEKALAIGQPKNPDLEKLLAEQNDAVNDAR